MNTSRALAALAATASVVVAACSGDDGSLFGPTGATHASAVASVSSASSSAATGAGGATSASDSGATSTASTGGSGGAAECMIADDCAAPPDPICTKKRCLANHCEYAPAVDCMTGFACVFGECCQQGQEVKASTNCPSGFYGSAFDGNYLTCSPICGAQITACCYPTSTAGCAMECPSGYAATGSPFPSSSCGISKAILCDEAGFDGGAP